MRKKSLLSPEKPDREEDSGTVAWREFDRSKLYTADLESALHQLLRVELAAHKALAGAELQTLKDFATVLAKLFPGRPPVRKLLETLQEWLASLPLDRIPYNAVLDLVNNKMRVRLCSGGAWGALGPDPPSLWCPRSRAAPGAAPAPSRPAQGRGLRRRGAGAFWAVVSVFNF